MLPPEPRLPEARQLIDRGNYFVVHAPRQTGKTTTLIALARSLTAEGRYAAVYATCEVGRAAGDDYKAAQRGILADLRSSAETLMPEELWPPEWPDAPDDYLLLAGLREWAQTCPRPLVILLDEIDALVGPSLYSVLSQLRAGSSQRPDDFPHSVAVCGLRDIRDYKTAAGGDPSRMGGASPFNIKTKSLRLEDFTLEQVRSLYAQHTAETGQEFTTSAVERAFALTRGQPWLVNALAAEVVGEMLIEPPAPLTAEHIEVAKERLILARATHLDSLVAKLSEPRVRRVIEPLIAGTLPEVDETFHDDVSYARDLGLIATTRPIRVANPIYREVIVRVLGDSTEDLIATEPRSFVLSDGRLDFPALLREFADFWRQHGEVLTRNEYYHEVAPQLVIMAYLHRVINGGGTIDREYGVGRGRIDLVVRWPYRDGDGKRRLQLEAMELKVWRAGRADPTPEGLQQLDDYLERLGVDHGTLVVFDRRDPTSFPSDRTGFSEHSAPSGRAVTLLRA